MTVRPSHFSETLRMPRNMGQTLVQTVEWRKAAHYKERGARRNRRVLLLNAPFPGAMALLTPLVAWALSRFF